jgi:eukaryotic-like serine/threonine-protein kinase
MLNWEVCESAAEARVGQIVEGKWRLLRLIGCGGMGAVYEARDPADERVAIKILHATLAASPRHRARLLREARVANAVNHSGVVRISDQGITDDGAAFLVMELLEGLSLGASLRESGGRLPLPSVLGLADQLLEIVAAAHQNGVTHRDLKPDNLFITPMGALKVLDFGIARFRNTGSGSTFDTEIGGTLGTPAFMAQEQARGRWDEVDARTDIWAIGATLFTLLSGECVHRAETSNEQLGMAMTRPARSLATLLPGLSRPVVEVIDRALRFEPAERWRSASEMRAALRHAASSPASRATRDSEVSQQAESNGKPVTLTLAREFEAQSAEPPRVTSSGRRNNDHPTHAWRMLPGLAVLSALTALAVVVAVTPSRPPPTHTRASMLGSSLAAVSRRLGQDLAEFYRSRLLQTEAPSPADAPIDPAENSRATMRGAARPVVAPSLQRATNDIAVRTHVAFEEADNQLPDPLDRRR